ncbi:MAG: hypothetical protein WCF53_08700, partial [Pseudolabrys sp.]
NPSPRSPAVVGLSERVSEMPPDERADRSADKDKLAGRSRQPTTGRSRGYCWSMPAAGPTCGWRELFSP